MNLNTIREKIHKTLFPTYHREAITHIVTKTNFDIYYKQSQEKEEKIKQLNKEIEDLKQQNSKKSAERLLKYSISSDPIDFINVDQDGLPNHFLLIDDAKKRTMYISQLHEIYTLEVWHEMIKYYINAQANYTMRNNNKTETALLTGRAAINSIAELKYEVDKGHLEYVDRSKPPEEFDKFSVELFNEND